ncbi:MAG: ABC transporter ATP-binding protein [Desulfobulbaceae bacterium]|jgi:putative ABC transport system ATP-binding protein|nr:ABC transporter ATP-binding protein [Desulfobulbaceae bacterium]
MMNDFVRIEKISKIFTPAKGVAVAALQDIDLTIAQHDLVVLNGPSGSGKTTLLNIIGGLDEPTQGQVSLAGQRLTGMGEKEWSETRRDHIGFVFQAYNLLPVLSARENIEYIMRLQNRTSAECAARSLEVARKLGIEAVLDALPHELSGGQQQRVAVARAVASKPRLILADEPTANLDSKNGNDLMEMMQRLNEDEGVTIIFSSHDPMVINTAKRSIVLHDGRVVEG